MGRRTVTQFANQIKRVLSPAVINDLGRDAGFCVRERLITPYRLVVSLLAGHAMGRVETLADIQRQSTFATTVAYKPFHNQLAKRTFPDFMREVLSRILQPRRCCSPKPTRHWVSSGPFLSRMDARLRSRRPSRAVSRTIQQAKPRGGRTACDDELARRIGRGSHADGGYGIGTRDR